MARPPGGDVTEPGNRREVRRSLGAWTLRDPTRNGRLADWWSLTHVAWAAALTLVTGPLWAFVLMVLWEPFEVFVLSRLLWGRGVRFGHESLTNSVADVFFDAAGVLLALYLVLPWWNPFGV